MRVDASGLTAWAKNLSQDAAQLSKADALRHHADVTLVFETVEACLPARFPTLFADEASLGAELERRGRELATALDAVRGACELGVTAVWTNPEIASPEVDAAAPGMRYMLQRQAAIGGSERRRMRAVEVAEALEREAGSGLRRARRRVCPSTEVALSLALLVERQAAAELKQKLERQTQRDVRILVHGPWPPYTFAG